MSKVFHDDPDGIFVYNSISGSPRLMQVAHEVLESSMDVEEFMYIFMDETGEYVETKAVREGLLKFAEEENGPLGALSEEDIEDIRARLEEEL